MRSLIATMAFSLGITTWTTAYGAGAYETGVTSSHDATHATEAVDLYGTTVSEWGCVSEDGIVLPEVRLRSHCLEPNTWREIPSETGAAGLRSGATETRSEDEREDRIDDRGPRYGISPPSVYDR